MLNEPPPFLAFLEVSEGETFCSACKDSVNKRISYRKNDNKSIPERNMIISFLLFPRASASDVTNPFFHDRRVTILKKVAEKAVLF